MPATELRAMPMSINLVIFGASGDLTARKLVPSLFRMARKGRLPADVRIVGLARSPFSDDAYRDKMAGAVRAHAAACSDAKALAAVPPRPPYVAAHGAR